MRCPRLPSEIQLRAATLRARSLVPLYMGKGSFSRTEETQQFRYRSRPQKLAKSLNWRETMFLGHAAGEVAELIGEAHWCACWAVLAAHGIAALSSPQI